DQLTDGVEQAGGEDRRDEGREQRDAGGGEAVHEHVGLAPRGVGGHHGAEDDDQPETREEQDQLETSVVGQRGDAVVVGLPPDPADRDQRREQQRAAREEEN